MYKNRKGDLINAETVREEMEKEIYKIGDTNGEINIMAL